MPYANVAGSRKHNAKEHKGGYQTISVVVEFKKQNRGTKEKREREIEKTDCTKSLMANRGEVTHGGMGEIADGTENILIVRSADGRTELLGRCIVHLELANTAC